MSSLRDEVAAAIWDDLTPDAPLSRAEHLADAALAVVLERIKAVEPRYYWDDAKIAVLELFKAEPPQGGDAHATGVPTDAAPAQAAARPAPPHRAQSPQGAAGTPTHLGGAR
jgi:hypothetical protein